MILVFELILLTSIWCLGIIISTQEGMLFYRVRLWAEDQYDNGFILCDALVLCEWCVPSFHTFFGYAFALVIGLIDHFQWKLVFIYPIIVMGSSLICGMIWSVYKYLSARTEYYKNLNYEIEANREEIHAN